MSTSKTDILRLLRLVDNRHCADCGMLLRAAEGDIVRGSISFQVWLCGPCGGIHKSLLPYNRSYIKNWDAEWEPEEYEAMLRAGNVERNKVLERCVPGLWNKPTPESKNDEKQLWILAKYDCGLFLFDNHYCASSPGTLVTLPPRLIDYFMVISPATIKHPSTPGTSPAVSPAPSNADAMSVHPDGGHLEDVASSPENTIFEPTISSSFPGPTQLKDMEIPQMAATFAFPMGVLLRAFMSKPGMSADIF